MLPATPPLSCRQQHIFVHLSPDTYTSPLFTAHPADIVVATGQSAELQCRVTGQPMPSVTWYREGGGAVEIGDGISVSSSGDLVISSVTLSDDGDYYCVASNAVGSVRSLSATLDIAGTHHLLYSVAEEKRVCPGIYFAPLWLLLVYLILPTIIPFKSSFSSQHCAWVGLFITCLYQHLVLVNTVIILLPIKLNALVGELCCFQMHQ